MVTGQSFFSSNLRRFIIGGLWLSLAASCSTIVKNYQPGKPFVYKTNINITGNITSDTAAMIASRLKGQLDDSMRSRSVSKVFWSVMKNPPAYDNNNAEKSVVYMRALLRSMGYSKDSISYDTTVNVVKGDQYQTTINFTVKPGTVIRIDSFSYNFKQAELQSIAVANQKDALVKKGDPFAKAAISSELDRLVDLYRTNGYMRFGREEMIGLWDTLNLAILNPSMDPFEQIIFLDSIKKSRKEPKANLEIRLKPGFDSSKLTKYYVGNITVYPDYGPDSLDYSKKEAIVDGVKVIYYQGMFKPKILPQNIYLRRGDLYNQQQYLKTVNRFNSLGSWRLVGIEPLARKNQDTADFIIRLTPAKKYSFTTNLEGSSNRSAVSGNLFGVGVNLGLQNRNFGKSATTAVTNIRYGIEVSDSSFIQTQQFVISHNIYFPKPIPNVKWIPAKFRDNFRTVFSFNAGITERKDLFNLTTVNGSWGYEFQLKNESKSRNTFFSLRLPNIEYSSLKPRQKLLDLFVANPSLKYIFTDGLISSVITGVTITNARKKSVSIFRANAEASGLVAGLIRSKFFDDNLYRFIKTDIELIRKLIFTKSALVLRLFTGVGYEFNSTVNADKRNNLPFFKQYFAGGPNSMRAWGLRKLGPGSTVKNFKDSANKVPERYGDVQLETNIEYRFPAFTISGVKVDAAIFTDIGNVWYLKKVTGRPDEEVFNFSRLGKDLAVGVGMGFRVDFSFFVIRLDYSYKAKDPSPSVTNNAFQNKWFSYKLSQGQQFQLGISYPFIL